MALAVIAAIMQRLASVRKAATTSAAIVHWQLSCTTRSVATCNKRSVLFSASVAQTAVVSLVDAPAAVCQEQRKILGEFTLTAARLSSISRAQFPVKSCHDLNAEQLEQMLRSLIQTYPVDAAARVVDVFCSPIEAQSTVTVAARVRSVLTLMVVLNNISSLVFARRAELYDQIFVWLRRESAAATAVDCMQQAMLAVPNALKTRYERQQQLLNCVAAKDADGIAALLESLHNHLPSSAAHAHAVRLNNCASAQPSELESSEALFLSDAVIMEAVQLMRKTHGQTAAQGIAFLHLLLCSEQQQLQPEMRRIVLCQSNLSLHQLIIQEWALSLTEQQAAAVQLTGASAANGYVAAYISFMLQQHGSEAGLTVINELLHPQQNPLITTATPHVTATYPIACAVILHFMQQLSQAPATAAAQDHQTATTMAALRPLFTVPIDLNQKSQKLQPAHRLLWQQWLVPVAQQHGVKVCL